MLNVMKRNALRILSAFIIAAALIGSVSAHPGRTDSNGGHTDHSTGEYHYHHGYSAHDHYDMDGDGDEDCPYDFKDKTGSSSGSSGYSSGSASPAKDRVASADKTITREEDIPKKEDGFLHKLKAKPGNTILILIGCAFGALCLSYPGTLLMLAIIENMVNESAIDKLSKTIFPVLWIVLSILFIRASF